MKKEIENRKSEIENHKSKIINQKSTVVCPFCASSNTELFSLFGSQLLTTEYYCLQCRTVFESVKE